MELSNEISPVLMDINNLLNIHLEKLPETLYHYTNVEALYKITESRKLWVTSSLHLNDSRECALVYEIARDYIGKIDNLDTDFRARLIDCLEMSEGFPNASGLGTFVLSFSAIPDQLSQWRGYCTDGGYSIGFNSNMLKNSAWKQNFFLYPCLYVREEQEQLVEKIINYVIKMYKPTDDNERLGIITSVLATAMGYISPLVKDKSFSEELEWRVFSELRDWQLLKFRYRGSLLVPYLELSLPESNSLGIDEIVVGPMPHQALARSVLLNFLRQKNIKCNKYNVIGNPEVCLSKIPYRSFS